MLGNIACKARFAIRIAKCKISVVLAVLGCIATLHIIGLVLGWFWAGFGLWVGCGLAVRTAK